MTISEKILYCRKRCDFRRRLLQKKSVFPAKP